MLAFSLNSSEGSQSRVPSAASVMRVPLYPLYCLSRNVYASAGRRSAVHGQGSAVDERRLGRAEEGAKLGDLLGFDEAFDRGSLEHHLLYNLVLRDPAGPGLVGDLVLDERRPHVGRADAVRRDAFGASLQSHDLRETF